MFLFLIYLIERLNLSLTQSAKQLHSVLNVPRVDLRFLKSSPWLTDCMKVLQMHSDDQTSNGTMLFFFFFVKKKSSFKIYRIIYLDSWKFFEAQFLHVVYKAASL